MLYGSNVLLILARHMSYRVMLLLVVAEWHLGCLYGECLDWEIGKHNTTSVRKWKSANPGNLGFDEYHATIAVTPTSTTNCGCNASWSSHGKGCIAGGGRYVNHAIHNTSGAFMLGSGMYFGGRKWVPKIRN